MPNQGEMGMDISASYRRKMQTLLDDIHEIRDSGHTSVETPQDNNAVLMFKGMYIMVSSLFERFDTLYHDLCDLVDVDGLTSVVNDNDHFMRTLAKRYTQEAHAFMAALKSEPSPSTSQATTANTFSFSGSRARAKLPTIEIPKFNGNRSEWPRFHDLFESLVIGDNELKDIDRFHYLVSSLQQPAAAIISNLPINEVNFSVAWQSLKDCYDNKRLLASTYLDELLNLKPLERKPPAKVLSDRIALLSKTVAAFKLLNINDGLEFIFFHLACRCIDTDTRIAFENHNSAEFPSFDSLINFLRKRSTAVELASGSFLNAGRNPVNFKAPAKGLLGSKPVLVANQGTPSRRVNYTSDNTKLSVSPAPPPNCPICHELHFIVNCLKFVSASTEERQQLLSGWKGCRNCLRMGHQTQACSSRFRCRFCKAKHHSLLHNNYRSMGPSGSSSRPQVSPSQPSFTGPSASRTQPRQDHPPSVRETTQASASLNTSVSGHAETLLGTAISLVGVSTPTHQIRLVIDSGSQFSFMTRKFANRLGLKIKHHDVDILGIGNTPLPGFKGQAKCTLSSLHSASLTLSVTVVIVDSITSPLPGFDTPMEMWKPFSPYELADPCFWVTSPVDFLLGCDLFGDILTGEIITVEPNLPKLLGTIFGHVVVGRVRDLTEAHHLLSLHISTSEKSNSLNMDLQRFWEIEEPPAVKKLNPEDEYCEDHFRRTHFRLSNGHYGVRLPFKGQPPSFIGTRAIATRRLIHLEAKLERNPLLKEKYHAFMQEYLDLGHMQPAKCPGLYYIPHHGVVKGEGAEMKVRVVFDAAARSSAGSLNDNLLVGPKLQTDQVLILLNFRLHQYVFTTDAVKMYRQIVMHKDDCSYQHILWRFDPSEPITEYELSTVTYGTASAPFQAIRVIHQLADDEGAAYPLAASALLTDMYVDDLPTGSDTLENTLTLLRQVVTLMKKGGFLLSKWAANHPVLLDECRKCNPESIPSTEPIPLEASDSSSVKILGLQWDPSTDEFSYKITAFTLSCTKRAVLSAVAKIWDPLGYLGPIVILAKLVVQEAWKQQLDWDDQLPLSLQAEWNQLIKQLPTIRRLLIPRWIQSSQPTSTTLLVFADASEKAYCASVFLRTDSMEGPQCNLVIAKTKLAPVKTLTIPRLELCAALLAARLLRSIQEFRSRISPSPTIYFFTDSTVVLAWLLTPAYKLKTFVANRVSKIRELTGDATWHHVSSSENPSDIGSRGLLPDRLIGHQLWFHGPSWALSQPHEWPRSLSTSPKEVPELKPDVNRVLSAVSPQPCLLQWFMRFSSLTKLLRSLCYVVRFIDRLKGNPRYGILTLKEIRSATDLALKLVQGSVFFNSPSVTFKGLKIPSNLTSLHPFIDHGGVLRVGGRLRHSNLPYFHKHPALLPAKHHFTTLIMEHYHRAFQHPGPNILLAALRTRYWILNARRSVRHLSRSCVTCRKFNAPPAYPFMGDLPGCRFRECRAFLHVGIDFAGPFLIRESLRRKAPQSKAYLSIFVCFSTKAIHLELVTALSTDAFQAAFNRFIGRRGLPEKVFTDNGTNFVGVSNELKELYQWLRQQDAQESLITYAASKEVEWSFIPPRAPNQGGIWEAGVKSVKRLMQSVYGSHMMTFEELSTLLIEIEAILNSRPLYPLSSDPNDLSYLCPGHFLIGSPLLAIPQPSLIETPENRLSRWEVASRQAQHFWHRWRTEYLNSLQQRHKWKHPSYNLQVGDLVLVLDETLPRRHWPVGRVKAVHPGPDKVVRVATVTTSFSKCDLKRPSSKLIPLFLPSSSPEPPLISEAGKENP